MKRKTTGSQWYDSVDWRDKFTKANEAGADTFGTLWLAATSEAVAMFREAGYGADMETDMCLRAAISRAVFRVLSAATRHPNNLERAKQKATNGASQ